MKGKGKSAHASTAPASPECPLQFPDLRPVEHGRQCPRYTAVLSRTEDDGIGIEEIDTLQTELETLLASVAKRMRQLQSEINTISNWQEKGKEKKTPTGKEKSEGKRGKSMTEEKTSKKMKDSSGKAVTPPATASKPKSKMLAQVKGTDVSSPADSPKPPEVVKLPKKDTPNKFWSFVEPYCSDITKDDLKVLEDIIKQHEDDTDFYKIPPLGKHYIDKWSQEDMNEEQREGKLGDRRRSNSGAGDASSFLRRTDVSDLEEKSPFGPLTQRLVSALIEENIMAPLDDGNITEADAAEAASISPRSLAKQLNIGNAAQLEKRIKKELEEHGIIELDDKGEDSPDDEILMELKKKQQELKALSQHNLLVTKRLYKLAKEEMQRQEIRRKLAAADAEVLEAYRKVQLLRQKKRTLTKKEKDTALKAIKDREMLVRQLDSSM